jgi:HEAT repeat protein
VGFSAETAEKSGPDTAEQPEFDPRDDPGADEALGHRLSEALAQGAWYRPAPTGGASGLIWHHDTLDALIVELQGDTSRTVRKQLDRALRADEPVVAANATIVAVRLGDDSVLPRLSEIALAQGLAEPQRCAAIEALGRSPAGPDVADLLRGLLDQIQKPSPSGAVSGDRQLGETAILALARHVEPNDEPRFLKALAHPDERIRRAAVMAWVDTSGPTPPTAANANVAEDATGEPGSNLSNRLDSTDQFDEGASPRNRLPRELLDLRVDPSTEVRLAVLDAVVMNHDPRAVNILEGALRDHRHNVRLAAISRLGQLSEPAARERLLELLDSGSDADQAAAIAALAEFGDLQAVLSGGEHPKWRQRAAAAEALAQFPGTASAELARQMMKDRSPIVQQSAVRAVAQWPLEWAGDVLLHAMAESTSYATRKAAADQLAERWPPAAIYAIDAPDERRGEVIAGLVSDWTQQFPRTETSRQDQASHGESLTQSAPNPVPVPEARLEEVREQIAALGEPTLGSEEVRLRLTALHAMGENLLPALRQLARDGQGPLPETVYQQLLPLHGETFVVFQPWSTGDVRQRRLAASQLRAVTEKQPLGRMEYERLYQLLIREQDELVWRQVLDVLDQSDRDEAIQIVYAGLSHPAPEVRRRACEHLQGHPSPRHGELLVRTLEDPSPGVVRAAVRALAECGPIPRSEPIEALLTDRDGTLRLEAARTLTQLGFPQGKAALQRLIYDSDRNVRRQAAIVMGQTGDAMFVPSLMNLLDGQLDEQRVAVQALKEIVGAAETAGRAEAGPGAAGPVVLPANYSAPRLAEAKTLNDEVQAWKRWWQTRQARHMAPEGVLQR